MRCWSGRHSPVRRCGRSSWPGCDVLAPPDPRQPHTVNQAFVPTQFAGTVSTGAYGVTPVSASEKKISRNEKIRFDAKSPSSIQYQVPR